MATNELIPASKLREGHGPLVIPPLLAVLLFCFSMVLMQPNGGHTGDMGTAASQTKAKNTSVKPVPAMPLAEQAPLPTIDETVITTSTPAAATNPTSITTSTPQPTNNRSVSDLQSASSKSASGSIKVPSTSAIRTQIKINY